MRSRFPKGSSLHKLDATIRLHLLTGWFGLLVFLSLGIVLEIMHGLKLQFYLNTEQEMRRLMWTLAHTHGTLFSLIQIAFALTLKQLAITSPSIRLISAALIAALLTMPVGFLLGGAWHYKGDPGIGIVLVPVGGLMMLLAVAAFLPLILRGNDKVPNRECAREGDRLSERPGSKRGRK